MIPVPLTYSCHGHCSPVMRGVAIMAPGAQARGVLRLCKLFFWVVTQVDHGYWGLWVRAGNETQQIWEWDVLKMGMGHKKVEWEWDMLKMGMGNRSGTEIMGMEQTGKKLTVKWLTRLCPDQVCQLSCSSVSYWAAWVLHCVTQERGRETWSNKLGKKKLWYFFNTEIRWAGLKFEPCLFLSRPKGCPGASFPPPFLWKKIYLPSCKFEMLTRT